MMAHNAKRRPRAHPWTPDTGLRQAWLFHTGAGSDPAPRKPAPVPRLFAEAANLVHLTDPAPDRTAVGACGLALLTIAYLALAFLAA